VKTARLITCSIGLAVLVTVGSLRAYAQFEVDPDHYETRDAEPLPQSKTSAPDQLANLHYEGSFVLPYWLQCNRSSLPPGRYSIAVDSEGRAVRVTVSGRGHTTRIEAITKRQSPRHRRDALVVDGNGGIHHLSVIHVPRLDLVFSPTLGLERPEDGKPRNLQEIPLILASRK
jgi:hypothetical protein